MLATPDSDDLSIVRGLKQRRIEAARQNDADRLAPLLDAQFIHVNGAGDVFDKDHYLRSIRTGSLRYDHDFDVLETDFEVLDDLIILVGIMVGCSGPGGKQQAFQFPCVGMWRKNAGQWRMLVWQSSSGS